MLSGAQERVRPTKLHRQLKSLVFVQLCRHLQQHELRRAHIDMLPEPEISACRDGARPYVMTDIFIRVRIFLGGNQDVNRTGVNWPEKPQVDIPLPTQPSRESLQRHLRHNAIVLSVICPFHIADHVASHFSLAQGIAFRTSHPMENIHLSPILREEEEVERRLVRNKDVRHCPQTPIPLWKVAATLDTAPQNRRPSPCGIPEPPPFSMRHPRTAVLSSQPMEGCAPSIPHFSYSYYF